MNKVYLPIFTATLALVGCSLAPKYNRPDEKLPTQLGEGQAVSAQDASLEKWWERFNDPTLNKLVEQALAQNTDLMMAFANVKQSRAALGIAKADYGPSLSANSTNYRKDTVDRELATGQKSPDNYFYQYGLLSYELDLFGRVASSNKAARQDLLSSEYAAQSAHALVAAQTASTYFNLIAAREQLRITQQSLETRKHTLKIQEDRLAAGYGSDGDRQQAVAELANAEVTIPDLKNAIESTQTALRILVGASAEEIWNKSAMENVPEVLPEPPAISLDVIPATVLEARPDVVAAEAQLKAANARIGVARAQRLPAISLTAILGTADNHFDDLFQTSTSTWTLTGAATAPVFDFGRSRNRVKSAKAAKESAEWNYRAVVRNAFKELRDAATSSDLSRESVESRTRQAEAWDRNLEIALSRSEAGYDDPLTLLDSERGQLAAQLALVSAKRDRLVAAVNLCRALGGGWTTEDDNKSAK